MAYHIRRISNTVKTLHKKSYLKVLNKIYWSIEITIWPHGLPDSNRWHFHFGVSKTFLRPHSCHHIFLGSVRDGSFQPLPHTHTYILWCTYTYKINKSFQQRKLIYRYNYVLYFVFMFKTCSKFSVSIKIPTVWPGLFRVWQNPLDQSRGRTHVPMQTRVIHFATMQA